MEEGRLRKQGGVGRVHVERFLKRERADIERLRAQIGTEIVSKLDRRLLRELIYEAKEQMLARELDADDAVPPSRHRVLVNMRSGRQPPPPGARIPGPRDRRRAVNEMRRAGEMALDRLEASIKSAGAEVRQRLWLTHSAFTELTREQLEQVSARADVGSVTLVKDQFALCLDVSRPLIQADQVAATLGFNGTGVNVAVVDTGVDTTHVALAGVVVAQQDLTGASGNPAEGVGDLHGHGTHVAGIIASQDGTFTGIAPGATITDIKIMNQFGNTDQVIAVAGITAAVTAGVNVMNHSWGFSHANGAWADPPQAGQPDGTCVLCTAIDNASAAGVTCVVAAGNEDNDTCADYDTHIRCPGLARTAITVGASDDNDAMAGFSSIGPTPDGRQKPDVVAPGVQIASCRAAGTTLGNPIDANFTNLDGTSMASPHVAGVVALMQDRRNNALLPANILGFLTATAVNIGAPANQMGAGRVDALAAVSAA